MAGGLLPVAKQNLGIAEMEIRPAREDDAVAACETMRWSIKELCVADHNNDPAILARWLANKTPENLIAWIARPSNCLLVAVENDAVLSVGCVTDAGEITLNYVSPGARFRGVSRAMLNALEERARERGNARCTLRSTGTARRFYRAAGYVEDAPAPFKFGMPDYPMSKILGVDRQ
jgi:GNAT superfamily N-acetyltransferase